MDDGSGPMLWRGKPVEDLTREEAIGAVRQLCRQLTRMQSMPIDYRAVVRRKLGYEQPSGCSDCGCAASPQALSAEGSPSCPFGLTACPFVRAQEAVRGVLS